MKAGLQDASPDIQLWHVHTWLRRGGPLAGRKVGRCLWSWHCAPLGSLGRLRAAILPAFHMKRYIYSRSFLEGPVLTLEGQGSLVMEKAVGLTEVSLKTGRTEMMTRKQSGSDSLSYRHTTQQRSGLALMTTPN